MNKYNNKQIMHTRRAIATQLYGKLLQYFKAISGNFPSNCLRLIKSTVLFAVRGIVGRSRRIVSTTKCTYYLLVFVVWALFDVQGSKDLAKVFICI